MKEKKCRQKKNLVRHQFESLPITVHAIFAQNAHLLFLLPNLLESCFLFWPHRNNLVFFCAVLDVFFYNCMRPHRHHKWELDGGENTKKNAFFPLFISFSVIFFLSFFFFATNCISFLQIGFLLLLFLHLFFLFFNSNAMQIPS